MRIKMMALAAAFSLTIPAVAQTADTATPAPVKEKKICRRIDQTGSIIGSKPICHTKAEWTQIDGANGRNADKALEAGRSARNPNGTSGM